MALVSSVGDNGDRRAGGAAVCYKVRDGRIRYLLLAVLPRLRRLVYDRGRRVVPLSELCPGMRLLGRN